MISFVVLYVQSLFNVTLPNITECNSAVPDFIVGPVKDWIKIALLSFLAIDGCQSDPCQNGGTCLFENGKVVCKCKGKFSGPTCAGKLLF